MIHDGGRSTSVEAWYQPFKIKMLVYKRESKKVSMNGRLKIQKRKKNSKKLLLNLLINFTKMDDQKIRIDFHFQNIFRCLWANAICVGVNLGLRKWNWSKDSQIYTNTQLEELAKSILSKLRRIDQKSGGVQEEFLSMVAKIAEAKEKLDSGHEDSWPKEILDIRSGPCWACEASQVP